jgi:hypothetical protein
LRFSREQRDTAARVADRRETVHHTLADAEELVASRLYRLLEPFANEAIVYLHGTSDGRARQRIETYARDFLHVELAVSGDDLAALGLEPGPEYSAILDRALDDRLDGVAVGREAELEHLRRIATERGLL